MPAALAYDLDSQPSHSAANDNTATPATNVIILSPPSRRAHYPHTVAARAAAFFSLGFIPRIKPLASARSRAARQTRKAVTFDNRDNIRYLGDQGFIYSAEGPVVQNHPGSPDLVAYL